MVFYFLKIENELLRQLNKEIQEKNLNKKRNN